MDVVATLIEAYLWDPSIGQFVTCWFTNRNDPRATTALNKQWEPILSSAPSVGLSVFNGAFTGAGEIDLGSFTLTLVDGIGDKYALMVWSGALIKIYAGDMTTGNYGLIQTVMGDGAERRGRTELEVQIRTRESVLDTNLGLQAYGGIGNLEGDPELAGTMKPMVFGNAKICRAVLIDSVRQIYQVHAYGPVQSIYNVYEGGQTLGMPVGNYSTANFTAFRDDVLPQGSWVTLNQSGLFRLGSQPSFPITCDVLGDTGAVVDGYALYKVGDIVRRIMQIATNVAVEASSVNTINALMPQPQDDYFDSQLTVADALKRFLLGIGGYYTFNESGNMILGLVRFTTPYTTLSGNNDRLPDVLGINQMPSSAPAWQVRVGANQCHFVHNSQDIVASLIDLQASIDEKGKTFPPSNVPPTGAVEGDLWPDTSVSPTTMRRFNEANGTWVAVSNQITTANQIPYLDGFNLEYWKPFQINSDKTLNNYAAGFIGQGILAGLNSLSWLSGLLSGIPGALSLLGDGRLDASNVSYSSGITVFSLKPGQAGSDKTGSNIAAGFSGQGLLAVQNSIAWASGLLTSIPGALGIQGDGKLAGGNVSYYNGGPLISSLQPSQAGSDKTSSNYAQGFAGQGVFATAGALNRNNIFAGFFAANSFSLGYTVTRQDGTSIVTESMSITSMGYAAGFAGQGALATLNGVGVDQANYGLTGEASIYYSQNYNDNNQTGFTGFLGVGIHSAQGCPIHGHASSIVKLVNGSPGTVRVRVVRQVPDGTVVWGGSAGVEFYVDAGGRCLSIDWIDSVPAGTDVQYDVQVQVTSGMTIRWFNRFEMLRELVRDRFSQIWIIAPAGEGPGAGSSGGGSVNGTTSGTGGVQTGTYSGGYGGLARFKQEIQQ
jgi:hypothetical protein